MLLENIEREELTHVMDWLDKFKNLVRLCVWRRVFCTRNEVMHSFSIYYIVANVG